jgi:sugar (pentulose or hexulose) kinase
MGIDLGTSAVKGVLLSPEGSILSRTSKEITLISTGGQLYEMDAAAYLETVLSAVRELAAEAAGAGLPVAAMSMAAAAGNSLLCSGNGEPRTPIISWMDTRIGDRWPEFFPELDGEKMYRITGWPWRGLFSLAHFRWFLDHYRDAVTPDTRFVMNNDWLYHRLTGKWAVDPSSATPSYLYDQQKGDWSAYILNHLGIGKHRLSRIYPAGASISPLSSEGASAAGLTQETVMVTGCFDHPGAARGVGVLDPGETLFSCGTSWVGFYPLRDRETGLKAKMLIDPFRSPDGPWAGMTSLPKMGTVVSRLVEALFPGKTMEERYSVFNTEALRFKPVRGAPVINPLELTHGNIEQVKAETAKRGISWAAYALMTGSAYGMKKNNLGLEQFGITPARVVMAGGPAESGVWPQIIADVLERPVQLAAGKYAGAVGAAVLAGIGTGFFRDEYQAKDVLSPAMVERIIEPRREYRHFHRNEFRRCFQEEK